MKLTPKSHSPNLFNQAWLNVGTCLCLSSFAQPLTIQSWLTSSRVNEQLSQASNQSRQIAYSRLEIGGVKLSMSEVQVKKVLGKPLEIKNSYEAVAGKTRILRYSGITVKLLEDVDQTGSFSVYEIKAESSQYATRDGVKVGDSISKVIRVYGRPESEEVNALTTLSYPVNYISPAYFVFTLQNGKVKTITCGDFLG